MKKISLLFSLSLVLFFSCTDYKRPSQGRFFEVLVVMDSTQFQSPLADSIRATFGGSWMTLPAPENRYDLRFFSIKTKKDLEYAKQARNLILAAPLDEKSIVADFVASLLSDEVIQKVNSDELNAIRLEDKWVLNQWILMLTGSTQESATAYLSEHQDYLMESLNERERKRWMYEVYDKGRQVAHEDTLWNEYGWKIGIQHDYNKHIDELGFVSFRRLLANNDRWIWVWWKDNVTDLRFLNPTWVNAARDSIMEKHIRGSRENSYVQTEYRRDIEQQIKTMNGRYTIQTNGTWRMENDLMGGPFVNYTMYDEAQRRLYMVEFAQFAPKLAKRNFVRQFESMALTFETDSLFKGYPDIVLPNE
ncbi:DUF4837 family protein [bacterium]|nr:MAG: DUF4837 family protein [bacterium]